MDVRQLQYFLAIVAQRGYTAAARSLFVSQPTLTVAMHRLEEELGTELFERAGRRVILSDAGRRFRDEARRIIDALDELEVAGRGQREYGGSRLVVATTPELAISLLAAHIAAHRSSHPNVRIDVVAPGPRESAADCVAAGAADVGIDAMPTADVRRRAGERVVGVREFVWVAKSELSTLGWPPDPIRYAMSGRLIAAPPGSITRQLLATALPTGFDIDAVGDVVSEARIESLILAGRGLALLPEDRAVLLRETRDVAVATPVVPLRCDVVLSWRPGARSPATRSFVELAGAFYGAGALQRN